MRQMTISSCLFRHLQQIRSSTTTPLRLGRSSISGSYTGNLVFEMQNLVTGSSFFSNTLDGNGDYHAKLSANYADFGVGSLGATAAANIANFGK